MFSSSVKFHRLRGVSIAGRVISCTPLAMGDDAKARADKEARGMREPSPELRRALESMSTA
jgi:hypothetical protein